MQRSQLKIATIGAWGHLGRVLGEIDQAPQFRVCAMAKALPDEDPRESYGRNHACAADAAHFDDHRHMLHAIDPDVVIISTRPDRIVPLAIEAAEQGRHLICEKPLALDHVTLKKLWDTCFARGVQCVAILNNHVHPVIAAAREAVRTGRIGTVAIVNARKSYKWANRPSWFGRRENYGGTIPWIGIHALDFIYSITDQTFTSVAAMHSNVAHASHPQCEDNAALALRLSGGGHATASLDLLRPAAAETHGDDWFRVVGSRGMIEGNMMRKTCTLITDQQPAHDLPLGPLNPTFTPLLREIDEEIVSPEPSHEMRRAFMLTHVALVARDAADRGAVLPIHPEAWSL